VGKQLRAGWRYGGATAFTVLVTAGRLAMNPWWGLQSNRHLVFLPTVMLVAWFAGFGPGLVSAVLCTLALAFFWTAPVSDLLNTTSQVLFLVIAIAIAALIESLRRARARADGAAKSRQQVLAVVAHDLRNPLATIKLTSTALREHQPDDQLLAHRLAMIDRAASRMDSLIRDLVDASRMEHAGVELTVREEPVETILREAVDAFAPLAREKGLTIEASAPARTTVACDRGRVLQVLGNLIGNSLRFTPPGGHINLRGVERPDGICFEVADTGPGIPPEDVPHIFERYWNSDGKGSGLGLYIAQTIVRAHGGQMGVDPRPGSGARFSFTLPRAAGGKEAIGIVPAWLRDRSA
jgi:signal transduction histidine kinase